MLHLHEIRSVTQLKSTVPAIALPFENEFFLWQCLIHYGWFCKAIRFPACSSPSEINQIFAVKHNEFKGTGLHAKIYSMSEFHNISI